MAALSLCGLAGPLPGPSVAIAQPVAQEDDPYAGRPIREIALVREIQTADGPRQTDMPADLATLARNQLRSQRGQPYAADAVRDDIARLNRTGRFGRVTSRVGLLDDGSVRLEYVLVVQPIVQDVQVVGNRSIGDADIAAAVGVVPGVPIDRFQLDRAARRVERLYREKGFYRAEVTWDEEELLESGIVVFRVQEAQRTRVTDIRFEGADSYEDKFLRAEIETRKVGLFNKGRLDFDTLDEDVAALIRFYRDRGHLDIRVGRTLTESPNGKEVIVTFVIDEGPVYTLRDVRIVYDDRADDEQIYTAAQVAGLMTIRPGDVYAVTGVRESVEAVRTAFGKLGYVDIVVQPFEFRDPAEPEVDLELVVRVGQRAVAGEAKIIGNDTTRQGVVRRNLEIRPNRPLDLWAVNESQRRLVQTRLFDAGDPPKVTIQPPDPADPLYRDVLVEVTETNTGNFNIGAQFASDSGIVGTLEVEQRNFDLFDTPDSSGELFSLRGFRGGGQTLRLAILPGTEIQDYSLSLTEPALFETDYSGAGSVFYRVREFAEHERESYGTRFSVGRRFGTRWTGNISARFESIELSNIDADAPVDYYEFADRSLVDTLGVNLTRSTFDDRFRPTRGAQVELNFEQAGLMGGDFDFSRIQGTHKVFLKIDEDFLGRPSRLSLETRVGYIPQDVSDVPVYERFFQGGQSFRGFEFRTISPKGIRNDTGNVGNDPSGGTWSFFWGAQFEQPVYGDTFSLVAFLDTGTVTNSPGFADYRVSTGVGLRLLIPQLSPVPLAFDFGFPLLKEERDETRLFTFTVDVPF